ncbi:phosphatase PAP2 family protein [Chryseobacterium scophthalmum]|uniref:Undecaprenyl-diphosphatase n=1 Tax=Chryseobacterium scophthalmum TaxID=59733 RepID=A0A1N6FWC6_9FLAO|nr:phosphatase PAP2 family protein [Chryseobacterium scophthalmum]SIN99646.1 undecaprenyl-diphosphatase [Chryseobacterium scophthalmum]
MGFKNEFLSDFSTYLKDKRKTLFLCFSIFFIVVFLLLSFYVVDSSPKSWDLLVSQELQEEPSAILDVLMKGFSWLGTVYVAAVMVVVFSLIFLIFKYTKEAFFILSCLLSGGVSYVLKMLIDRPRPTTDFVRIVEETHYKSFPSGHVLFYTAFFGTLIVIAISSGILKLSWKIIISAICSAMIVLGAISRIYLGAHWFTDVIGGFIVGVLFVMLTGSIYLRSKKKQIQ